MGCFYPSWIYTPRWEKVKGLAKVTKSLPCMTYFLSISSVWRTIEDVSGCILHESSVVPASKRRGEEAEVKVNYSQ